METRTVIETHPRTTRNETIPRWSQGARITLGVITFLLIAIFVVVAASALLAPPPALLGRPGVGTLQFLLFPVAFAEFLLIAFYLSFAAQNPRTDNRLGWMLSMIVLPFAALPVYWWVHVWKAPYVGDRRDDHNVPGGQLSPQTD